MKNFIFLFFTALLLLSCDLGKTDGSDFYSGYYVKDKDNDASTSDKCYDKEEIGFHSDKKGYYISEQSNVMYSPLSFEWNVEKGNFYNILKLTNFSFDSYNNDKITPNQEISFEYYFTEDTENLYLKKKDSTDGFMLYKKTSSPIIQWK